MVDIDDIEKAVEFLRDSSELAAQARAERLHLEDYTKHLKAKLMSEHVEESLGAQERFAYADAAYSDHLSILKDAIHKDEKLRFLREAAQARIEVWRSQLSWAKTQESVR